MDSAKPNIKGEPRAAQSGKQDTARSRKWGGPADSKGKPPPTGRQQGENEGGAFGAGLGRERERVRASNRPKQDIYIYIYMRQLRASQQMGFSNKWAYTRKWAIQILSWLHIS